jgi:hypothetical protein
VLVIYDAHAYGQAVVHSKSQKMLFSVKKTSGNCKGGRFFPVVQTKRLNGPLERASERDETFAGCAHPTHGFFLFLEHFGNPLTVPKSPGLISPHDPLPTPFRRCRRFVRRSPPRN